MFDCTRTTLRWQCSGKLILLSTHVKSVLLVSPINSSTLIVCPSVTIHDGSSQKRQLSLAAWTTLIFLAGRRTFMHAFFVGTALFFKFLSFTRTAANTYCINNYTMHLNYRMGLNYYVLLVMIIVATIYKKFTHTRMVRMNCQSHRHQAPVVLQSCTNDGLMTQV